MPSTDPGARNAHTHEGWFWFCPVLAMIEDEDVIDMEPSKAWLWPVFELALALECVRIILSGATIPDYESSFMLKLSPIRR